MEVGPDVGNLARTRVMMERKRLRPHPLQISRLHASYTNLFASLTALMTETLRNACRQVINQISLGTCKEGISKRSVTPVVRTEPCNKLLAQLHYGVAKHTLA